MPTPTPKPAANANWYTIRAAGENTAEVLIYGDIGDSWYGESVTAQQFVKDLQAIKDKDLVVRINSYGGSVSDGVAIYNAIKRHPKSKIVEIDGVAISIASLIAMAGDTVRMAENALFMVHAPWGMSVGNAADMRKYAEVLDKYAEAMATSYAAKTGEASEAMYELLADGADHWYSAAEAKDGGFVDEVSTAAQGEESARYTQAALARFKVPAAAAARYAAIAAQFNPKKETAMTEEEKRAAEAAAAAAKAATKPDNVTEIEKAAQAKERERIKARNETIRAAANPFLAREGMGDYVNALLDDPSLTVEAAREKILAKLGEGAEPIGPIASGRIVAGEDARDKRVAAMSGSLLARLGKEQADGANPYRGMRMHEIARECLRAAGVRVDGMSVLDIADTVLTRSAPRAAQTTSDFPVILENTLHKLVLTGFESAAITYDRFCKIGDVSDFRAWNRIVPGLIGNLDTVNEHGEYRNKNIPDGVKNPVQATRKGNIVQVTPETIVNDDIGYIQTMGQSLGAAGPRTIERAVYTYLTANGALSDAVALFHATHANLAGSGAVPSVTTIDAATVALASQKAPGADAEYLGIMGPFVALVPLAQRLNTLTIAKAVYDPDTANKLQRPNPVAGLLGDVVSSPYLSGTAWYLFANPALAPVLEVVFLDGQRTPKVSAEENFRTGGLAWKVELPFGVGAVDYRGGYKNPGA